LIFQTGVHLTAKFSKTVPVIHNLNFDKYMQRSLSFCMDVDLKSFFATWMQFYRLPVCYFNSTGHFVVNKRKMITWLYSFQDLPGSARDFTHHITSFMPRISATIFW